MCIRDRVTTEDIKDLRVGDIIYLSGELVTGRDDVHHRVVHEGLTCPYDFAGGAVMHAGPIICLLYTSRCV